MKQHLNTLFVTTEGAYLSKDGQAVEVKIGHEVRLRVPLHGLGGIVCLGRISVSPALMGGLTKRRTRRPCAASNRPWNSARST